MAPGMMTLQVSLFLAVVAAVAVSTWLVTPHDEVETWTPGGCELCHGSFTPLDVEVELKPSTARGYILTAKVENPDEHEVRVLTASLGGLNLTTREPATRTDSGTVPAGGSAEHSFEVEVDAVRLELVLDGDEGFTGVNDLDLNLYGPNGTSWSSANTGADEAIRVSLNDLLRAGPGEFRAEIVYFAGEPAISYTLDWSLVFARPPAMLQGPNLAEKETHTFRWQLNLTEQELKTLTLTFNLEAYYPHNNKGPDSQDYTLSYSGGSLVEFEVYKPGSLSLGQGLGLTMLALVGIGVVSGFYSSARMKWPDWAAKAPFKRRNRGHLLAGLLLLGLAIPHAILLQTGLYQNTYPGLYTGLLTFTALVLLTYLTLDMRRVIDWWGYKNWQWVHRILVIGFLLLLLIHLNKVSSHIKI